MTPLSTKDVAARKEHKCVWCGEKILKGEKHTKRAYVMEGEFVHDRLHSECYVAMCDGTLDWLDNEGFCEYAFKRGTTEEK